MGKTNETEIRVIGLSRSGNHALINWLQKQMPGRICFLNCAEPKTNPYWSARPLDDGSCYRTNIPDFDIGAERAGEHCHKDWLIHSYEDTFLKPLDHPYAAASRDAWVGSSAKRVDILLLRDPYNLFASRLRREFAQEKVTRLPSPRSLAPALRVWKQHARQFLGERRVLQGDWVPVSYFEWASNKDYRRRLAQRIGLTFSDDGLHDVPDCAGGSSFDGRSFHRKASAMRIHERWHHFRHTEWFWQIFDETTHALALRAFPAMAEQVRGRASAPFGAAPQTGTRQKEEA